MKQRSAGLRPGVDARADPETSTPVNLNSAAEAHAKHAKDAKGWGFSTSDQNKTFTRRVKPPPGVLAFAFAALASFA